MNEIAERYRRLSDRFAARIAAVPADRWGAQTPCTEWTALDLVRHVVETQGMFLRLVGRELPDLPDVADDPAAAWDGARATVQADLEDPERAGVEFDGMLGRSRFDDAVDRFLSMDLVVHGWDLARATGQDERIEPRDIDHVWAATKALGDTMRMPSVCGPELTPPPGADEQTRLLAFVGRRA